MGQRRAADGRSGWSARLRGGKSPRYMPQAPDPTKASAGVGEAWARARKNP